MKSTIQLIDTDAMQAEMTITMTVAEWKELKNSLDSRYPQWRLAALISRLVQKATASLEERQEVKP